MAELETDPGILELRPRSAGVPRTFQTENKESGEKKRAKLQDPGTGQEKDGEVLGEVGGGGHGVAAVPGSSLLMVLVFPSSLPRGATLC